MEEFDWKERRVGGEEKVFISTKGGKEPREDTQALLMLFYSDLECHHGLQGFSRREDFAPKI